MGFKIIRFLFTALVTITVLQSCGGGSSGGSSGDQPVPEEAPSIRPISQVLEGEVAASLSRLPPLTTGLESGGMEGGLGGGSLLQGISAANATTTLTGFLGEAVLAQQDALKTKYWTLVQEKGKEYRDGLQKCRLVQTLGRKLTTFYQMSKAACALRAFDQEGETVIRRVAGEELEKGAFFRAPAKETRRILEIEGIDLFKTSKVLATIQPMENGVYQSHLVLCRANQTMVGSYQYRIDGSTKKFTISYEMVLPGYQSGGSSGTGTSSDREFKALGSFSGAWTSSGAQIFMDLAQPRLLTTHFVDSNPGGSLKTFYSTLEVLPAQMQVKALDFTTTATQRRESAQRIAILTGGSTPETLKVSEAAMKSKDRYHDTLSESIVYQYLIGMVADSEKTLGFKSSSESKPLKTVEAADFASDSLLSKTTLDAPKLSTIDSQKCLATGSSTYRASPSQAQISKILQSCDLSFQSLETLCDTFEVDEGDVLRALKESPKGIP